MEHITRGELLALGMTDRRIRADVAAGILVRLRAGRYAHAADAGAATRAVAAGGRLACVSELRCRGVWVLDDDRLHLHVARNASRLPAVAARTHWRRLVAAAADGAHVSLVDALIQAHGCLDPLSWMASVDSALHLGMIGPTELATLRTAIPAADRRLIDAADRRAESGLETIVRLIALQLGFRVRPQLRFSGVGRVDLVVEKWVVVETDGTAFHDVALSPRDRRRDAVLAARGITALRPGYSLVVFERAAVARQLIGAVESHRHVKDSGRLAARARRRLESLDLS
jgi:very-short-patch-repair endonuclease